MPAPARRTLPRGARLHHPATRDHLETARRPVVQAVPPRLPIRSIDDLDPPAALPIHPLAELPRVPRVGPDERQAGQRLAHLGIQEMPPAIPIVQVCAVDFDGKQQAGGIDEDPPVGHPRLRPASRLAPSSPRSGPPTPVVFAAWLSITAALGCSSRPSRARILPRSRSCARRRVPSRCHCRKW